VQALAGTETESAGTPRGRVELDWGSRGAGLGTPRTCHLDSSGVLLRVD